MAAHVREERASLRAWVERLARPRHFWAEARENRNVGNLIAEELAHLGYRVQEQGPYRNVVALPRNESRPCTLVGAHYDSIPNCPGADDNASGVAVLLACARRMAQSPSGANVGFVAFNAEEDGMLGSRDFVEHGLSALHLTPRLTHVLEMCGYRTHAPRSQRAPFDPRLLGLDRGTFVAIVARGESNRAARDITASASRTHRVSVETGACAIALFPDLRLSDHAPFWDKGLAATMWTDTAFFRNPHYHQPSDTPETLDYTFMAEITELLATVLGTEAA